MSMREFTNKNFVIKYTIEYIDSRKDLDYINNGIYNNGEPWDRYKTKIFDSLQDAINYFLPLYLNNNILDHNFIAEYYFSNELFASESIDDIINLNDLINKFSEGVISKKDKQITQLKNLMKNDVDILNANPEQKANIKAYLNNSKH